MQATHEMPERPERRNLGLPNGMQARLLLQQLQGTWRGLLAA